MADAQKKQEINLSSGESIGQGTYGHVYKFSDVNGFYVLKIPWRPKDAKAFEEEWQKLVQITHPNVVKYFGVVDVNDDLRIKRGIKMEFCERGSLKELIFNPTIIYSMTNISIWAEQLFGALAFVFDEHKIIHQDIKAEKIFVTADFSLKLGGFGFFEECDGTRSGAFDSGTERYRSPPEYPNPGKLNEMFPKVSHRNDVYSMGLVLWELVERRVVLSEFDRDWGFDRDVFFLTVYLQKLSYVEGPDCLGKIKKIVQICTRFQRRKRREASDILEEIKTLNEANGDLNQVTPMEDPNEKRLVRPIGFNGDTNWEPIDDPLHPKSSQDARIAEGKDSRLLAEIDKERPLPGLKEREEFDLSSGESIGRGTYGYVCKFSDANGVFVLKIPWRPEDAEAFEQECQKLAQIKHPNVVTYFGVVDVNDNHRKQLGIKMEFCERGSLKRLILNQTQIIYSMTDISIWAEQLFGALALIFDRHNIVHRDIKAENIFVTANFSLKLGDFGLWRESDGTRSGTFDRGTERYRSPPEYPDPGKPNETSPKLSHKNDVYSMGLVLWELVERRVVLSEYGVGLHFNCHGFHLTVHLQNLSHVEGPDCLGKMKEIVQTCTRFQRSERPKASDILKEIKTLSKANGDLNQVKPKEDPNEKRLIRPIGFNGNEDRQPVKDAFGPQLSVNVLAVRLE